MTHYRSFLAACVVAAAALLTPVAASNALADAPAEVANGAWTG